MVKWGATIMRPISKKEAYTRDRLTNKVLATYKIGSVTLTWLQTVHIKQDESILLLCAFEQGLANRSCHLNGQVEKDIQQGDKKSTREWFSLGKNKELTIDELCVGGSVAGDSALMQAGDRL